MACQSCAERRKRLLAAMRRVAKPVQKPEAGKPATKKFKAVL